MPLASALLWDILYKIFFSLTLSSHYYPGFLTLHPYFLIQRERAPRSYVSGALSLPCLAAPGHRPKSKRPSTKHSLQTRRSLLNRKDESTVYLQKIVRRKRDGQDREWEKNTGGRTHTRTADQFHVMFLMMSEEPRYHGSGAELPHVATRWSCHGRPVCGSLASGEVEGEGKRRGGQRGEGEDRGRGKGGFGRITYRMLFNPTDVSRREGQRRRKTRHKKRQ